MCSTAIRKRHRDYLKLYQWQHKKGHLLIHRPNDKELPLSVYFPWSRDFCRTNMKLSRAAADNEWHGVNGTTQAAPPVSLNIYLRTTELVTDWLHGRVSEWRDYEEVLITDKSERLPIHPHPCMSLLNYKCKFYSRWVCPLVDPRN